MTASVARTYLCGTAAIPTAFGGLTDSQLDHCYGLKSLLGQSSQKGLPHEISLYCRAVAVGPHFLTTGSTSLANSFKPRSDAA